MSAFARLLAAVPGLLFPVLTAAPLAEAGAGDVDFQRDVRPILSDNCFQCHGPDEGARQAGLRLDIKAGAFSRRDKGFPVVAGDTEASLLYRRITHDNGMLRMPPAYSNKQLTPEQVKILKSWIEEGATWDLHWSFRPLARPEIPIVTNEAWIRNPVDRFVLARLEDEGLEPSPEADRRALARRVALDLTGLPPQPKEVEAFVNDPSPGAYDEFVERLLESPAWGEHRARYWLDAARYADTHGLHIDNFREMWPYRDWVIQAFNQNKPFDRFTVEQIAGDLLPAPSLEQRVATGFHRCNVTTNEAGVIIEEVEAVYAKDRADTTGAVWLGLTVGCAQCHDHKFDPVTQKDYYQLYAFFDTGQEVNIEAPLPGELGPYLLRKPEYDKKRRELLADYGVPKLYPEWEKKMLETGDNLESASLPWQVEWHYLAVDPDHGTDGAQDLIRIPPSQRSQKVQDLLVDHLVKWPPPEFGPKEKKKFKELRKKLEYLKGEYPALSEALTLNENPTPPKTHLLIRGVWDRPGIEVQPNTPAFLPPLRSPNGHADRLSLARWLVSTENPLTARVTVNRMWQELFGRGLVETSEDFGTRGKPPAHRKLLDWLAVGFMDNGWNVKKVHKLLVTSATYRQSSKIRPELEERDPSNQLLARQLRLRLSAELVRDVTLAASGLLNPAIGGKSVRPPLPTSVLELGFGMNEWIFWDESQGADRYRRGLYTFFQRMVPYPQMTTFDAPDSLSSCSRRERSTTPLQALNLLNDPVFFEAAQGLAARVLREKPGSLSDRIEYAFRLCLARKPRPAEKDPLIRYYQQQKEVLERDPQSIEKVFPAQGVDGVEPAEAAAWVGLSSVLLNLDEFITRE
jgi:mono/diheme cytochrome c family protein